MSVIIVAYNAGNWLSRSVQSLVDQTLRDFECFIVDNGSSDGSIEALSDLDNRFDIIMAGENLGFAKANNLAIARARAPWVALLNPDAFARNDWLEKGLAATRVDETVTMVGSLQYMALEPEVLDGFGDCYHVFGVAWRSMFGHSAKDARQGGVLKLCEVFAPCAAAAFYHRETLDRVGRFDERFFCYHEDVDLGFRMRLDGGKCVQSPDAIVDHVSSGISGRASDFAVYHGTRNRIWTFFKNMPGVSVWILLPFHIAVNLAFLAVSVLRPGRFRPTWRGICHSFKGLPAVFADRRAVQKTRKVGFWDLFSPFSNKGLLAVSPFKLIRRDIHARDIQAKNIQAQNIQAQNIQSCDVPDSD